jgi:release factor glutamine methyltransferase
VSEGSAREDVWTIQRVLQWTTSYFEKRALDSPRLTAEVLLAHALDSTRVKLYSDFERPLSKAELTAFRALVEKRVQGAPTHYLTGSREFYNRRFHVDARVLIPRPETELLVEAILSLFDSQRPFRAVDLCTGSGCIAVTLAKERPLAQIWATDVSAEACHVAQLNTEAHGVSDRVSVLEGDLLSPIPAGHRFDAIVSNPPYIKSNEIAALSAEVRSEPRIALDGGEDGLDVLRRIARESTEFLKPGGLLALEISDTQGEQVRGLLLEAGYQEVRIQKDLERRDRYAFGRRPAAGEPQPPGAHG